MKQEEMICLSLALDSLALFIVAIRSAYGFLVMLWR